MSFVSTKEAGCQPTKRSNESEQDDEPHAKSARVSRIPVLDRKSDAASTPLPPKPSDGRLAWMPMQLKDGKAPRMPTSKIPIYMRKKRALSAPPSPKAASGMFNLQSLILHLSFRYR
ncbi:hypothetical protein QR680_002523 [Steinernema hermaphroditum]|uniref:Uncharacterized protein n=1 Tax=Steinernema hermaphroditum TaxID=289476 RepID=A0AA39H313_9BILA|nr:hypothetical protein QR680_002523 [Steinernema hermaphroditum]